MEDFSSIFQPSFSVLKCWRVLQASDAVGRRMALEMSLESAQDVMI